MNIKKNRLLALTLAALLAVSLSGCVKTPGGNDLTIINTTADNIVSGIDATGAAPGTPTPEATAAVTAVTTVLPTDGPAVETAATATAVPVETEAASTEAATAGSTETPAPTSTDEQTATATATDAPTSMVTDAPTATATDAPTATATDAPTVTSTKVPTATPTKAPTVTSTKAPTATPTKAPTATPTKAPTATPTKAPTATPTKAPTATPTKAPTATPTKAPTATPTQAPTATPTQAPTPTPEKWPEPVYKTGYKGLTGKSYTAYEYLSSDRDLFEIDHILWEVTSKNMSTLEKVKAVHDWLVLNIRYDTAYEIYDIAPMLAQRRAVCDGYSKFYVVALGELGIDARRITGTGKGESHAWNAVKMDDGKWYYVDNTWDDPLVNGHSNYPDGYNLMYEYFLVTQSRISEDHASDGSTTVSPNGTSLDYHYEAIELRYAELRAQLLQKINDENMRYAHVVSTQSELDSLKSVLIQDIRTEAASGGKSIEMTVYLKYGLTDASQLVNSLLGDLAGEGANAFKTGVSAGGSISSMGTGGSVRDVVTYYTITITVSGS